MGYSSTVAISIYGNEAEMNSLKEFYENELAFLSFDDLNDVAGLTEEANSNCAGDIWGPEDKPDFNFYIESVKWYEGNPAVDFFIALMEKAKTFDNLVVEYVCIGDELEDITQEWSYNNPELNEWRLNVNRTVEWA